MDETISTYQRLQNELSDIIQKAPKGTKLPSEPELAKQLGVSRATLREAMRTFESQGLLRRRQGSGTFVVGPSQVIESGLEVLESLETQAEKIGLDVLMGDCEVTHLKANPSQAKKLDIPEGYDIIKVSRVILTEGSPVAYLIDIFPEGILSEKELGENFRGSVLDLVIRKGDPLPSMSKTEISAIHAPSDLAKAMDIQRGDTLLLLHALLFDQEGQPIALSQSYFLPGDFRFHIIRKIGGVNQ